MNREEWIPKIKNSCIEAGTYRPFFDDMIETLATILEKRDEAEEQYNKTGAIPVIKHTNKGGATNLCKNPMLTLWDDLNKSALTYWRDLGLTPSGLKKINEKAFEEIKKKASGNLMQMLKEIKHE